jgi:hypothetical protein
MILVKKKKLVFVKINKKYINKKIYLDKFFLFQNDNIFGFIINVKEFSKTYIYIVFTFKKNHGPSNITPAYKLTNVYI